jgi:hypothetical protein
MDLKSKSYLDELDWRSWPKDPSFIYVDFDDEVRLQKDLWIKVHPPYTIRMNDHISAPEIRRNLTAEQVIAALHEINRFRPAAAGPRLEEVRNAPPVQSSDGDKDTDDDARLFCEDPRHTTTLVP